MAADGFTQLIDDANAFFADLKQNNTKEWFAPRKDHYTANIKKPAAFLGTVLAEDFSRIAGTTYTPKLFRIYRDVRFSKDKTPLNPHLHMIWKQPGDTPLAPAFFFGSEPGQMTVGFGIMSLKGPALTGFRAFVDRHGDALQSACNASGMGWSGWGAPALKRVPAPYDKDHPHADLLKKKSMILATEMTQAWRQTDGGLVAALRAHFEATMPLQTLIAENLRA